MGVLLLLPLSLAAQEDVPTLNYWASKPIECATPEKIVDLMRQYGEVPTIILEGTTAMPSGNVSPSKFVIAMNPVSETWTLLEFTGPTQACILGAGKGNVSLGKKNELTALLSIDFQER